MADLTTAVADGVMTICLDRPHVLNAVRRRTLDELEAALTDAEERDDVRVVVLTGRGRAFSAGEDLRELDGGLSERDALRDGRARAHLDRLQALTRRMLGHPKPLVASVGGIAVGLGAELALCCDIRIAGAGARMGFVEVARGLFPTNGATWLLPRVVGHAVALDLLLAGEIVDAERAHRTGLVTRLVPQAELPAATAALAASLAAGAPGTVAMLRPALLAAADGDLATALENEVRGVLACLAAPDAAARVGAFLARSDRPVAGGAR